MAHYDRISRKIHGVTDKNSISYLHEKGHEYQDKKGWIGVADMVNSWATYFMLIMIAPKGLEILIVLVIAPELFLELHAWYYAIKHKLRDGIPK